MNDYISSFRSYLADKFTSPLLPAFTISWVIINYPVGLTIISGIPPTEKIEIINNFLFPNNSINLKSSLLYPLASALFYSIIYPFLAMLITTYLAFINMIRAKAQFYATSETPVSKEQLNEINADHNKEISIYESEIAKHKRTIDGLRSSLSSSEEATVKLKELIKQGNSDTATLKNRISDLEKKLALAESASTRDGHMVYHRPPSGKRNKAQINIGAALAAAGLPMESKIARLSEDQLSSILSAAGLNTLSDLSNLQPEQKAVIQGLLDSIN